jgi:hypothetical protein
MVKGQDIFFIKTSKIIKHDILTLRYIVVNLYHAA